MNVERKPGSSKPVKYNGEERKARIIQYLEKHETIMSSDCMGINECTRYLALKDIKELIAGKKIVKQGYRKIAVYTLTKIFYIRELCVYKSVKKSVMTLL